jgi:hypothetical protein
VALYARIIHQHVQRRERGYSPVAECDSFCWQADIAHAGVDAWVVLGDLLQQLLPAAGDNDLAACFEEALCQCQADP